MMLIGSKKIGQHIESIAKECLLVSGKAYICFLRKCFLYQEFRLKGNFKSSNLLNIYYTMCMKNFRSRNVLLFMGFLLFCADVSWVSGL